MAAVDDIVAKSSPPRPQAQTATATAAPSSGPAASAPQQEYVTESAPQAQPQPPPVYSLLDPKSEPVAPSNPGLRDVPPTGCAYFPSFCTALWRAVG